MHKNFNFHLNLWFKMVQTHLVLVALAQYTHFAMSHACIILLHIVWWCCVSVLFVAGPASEEYRHSPNEEQYQCIDPSGKQPTIWSYRYNPMFSLLLSFTAFKTTCFKLLCAMIVEPISYAWPVIATVTRWNPLACVGVDWALCMCCSYLVMPATA